MAAYDCTEKIFLERSSIDISWVWIEMEQPYKLVTLAIGKFYQLKNDVEYILPIDEVNGELRFIKKRNHHTIKISVCNVGKLSASVLYENIKTSKPIVAEQLTEGEYEIVIPSSVVENAQNKFLKEGKLLIHFKCQESKKVSKRMHSCSREREKGCEERLSGDLKPMLVYPHYTDIIIHVEEQEIHVPRGLLAARSDYFKEYPDSDNNLMLCTHYEAVFSAVQYLYSGTLPSLDVLNEQEICRILEVALSLKIKSLVSKCYSYIHELIIRGDVEPNAVECESCVTS